MKDKVLIGCALTVTVVWVAFVVYSVVSAKKADAGLSRYMSDVVEKMGKTEVMVAVAPPIGDPNG